jgi:rod shape-determining protein MreD
VAPHFTIYGLKAEVVLALVVSWSILRGPEEGIIWAVLGGLFSDLFSAVPFGTSATAMALTALLVSWIGPSLSKANALLPLALAPVGTVAFNASSLMLLEALGWNVDWSYASLHVIAPLAVLDFPLMVPVYVALSTVNSRRQRTINW